VARPLREQLVLATLALLVPITAVVLYARGAAHREQLSQLDREVGAVARTVVAHIELTHPDPAALSMFLARIPPPAHFVVRDESGRVIAEQPPGAARPDQEPREARLSAASPAWQVTAWMPQRLAYDRAVAQVSYIVTVSALATLGVFTLGMVFVGRLIRAFRRLEGDADRIGEGDLSPLPVAHMPTRELQHVQRALCDMVDKLRDAREAIARQVEEERRMRREVETLQQQVIRQERLAAIGLLLSGIAHELNNPLQAISGFAELLQRDSDVRQDVRADLALIQKESARASGIIRNLSRFSRQQTWRPTTVYLTDVVASVVELRQRRLQEHGITLEVDEQSSLPVTAVMTELQQVLLNFVVNAEQAIAADRPVVRRIVIRTRDTATGVRLEVDDSGPGVKFEDESKLFQPFFTTKPVGEGTGLGLSVSYGIIQTFHGTIGYTRSPLGGARFFFELPSPELESRRA
jgi:C4-dicarboxylate-specific signal transduction histidine kinase